MNFKSVLLVIASMGMAGAAFAQRNIESNEEVEKPKMKKNNNIVSIAPIQFTENGVGFGISYEHMLDKDRIVSLNIPFVGSYRVSSSDYSGRYHSDPMYYLMPGLKFYPTGSKGMVKYAIGPSIVAGYGTHTDDGSFHNILPVQHNQFVLGVMVNNSMNVNLTKTMYMGLEFGLGFSYLHRWDGVEKGMEALVQGGFKMGYKF